MAKQTIDFNLPEGLDQSHFDSWKDKYGDLIHVIEAPLNKDETEKVTVVIKSPENDRLICGQIENTFDKDFSKARSIAINNCVLHGKEKVLENNHAFRAVSAFLFELIPNGKVAVKH